MTSKRTKQSAETVSLRLILIAAGLSEGLAEKLVSIPNRVVTVEPRRLFREAGALRDEVMFVRSGILAKFKNDTSGGRQIVALRFAGEIILPGRDTAQYGIQAITRSEVLVGKSADSEPLFDANPELRKFCWELLQRNESIGYEWLVNCGRRDSAARVAHLLCETAVRMRTDEENMINPFTQQQIADITGQTSVNVNRVLADMERQGLIRRNGREIEFADWPEMRRLGGFEPAYLVQALR